MDQIMSKKEQLDDLCRRYRVATLEVFGSAVSDAFDPETSDLDLLVTFHTETPREKADCYFGLLFALEELFGRPVDLITVASVTNPYIKAAMEETKRPLYAAA